MGIDETILGRVSNLQFGYKVHHEVAESFRPDHIKTKKWLVHEILKYTTGDFNKVAVLGSWNSILLKELLEYERQVGQWDFYDISHSCHRDRDMYHEANGLPTDYNSIEVDVPTFFAHEDIHQQYDLIINPSCEHMDDIKAVKGPLYALTSNDYEGIKGHINCISKHEELAIKNGINTIEYEGSLKLTNYTRFCTIGRVT